MNLVLAFLLAVSSPCLDTPEPHTLDPALAAAARAYFESFDAGDYRSVWRDSAAKLRWSVGNDENEYVEHLNASRPFRAHTDVLAGESFGDVGFVYVRVHLQQEKGAAPETFEGEARWRREDGRWVFEDLEEFACFDEAVEILPSIDRAPK